MGLLKRKQPTVKPNKEIEGVKKRLDKIEDRVKLLETTVKVYQREA